MYRIPQRSRRLAACVFLTALVLSGCDILSLGARNRPEELRVIVTAEGLEGPTPMVTSREFFFVQSPEGEDLEVQFLSADTVMVELPLDQTFDLAPTFNFLVRMLPPSDLPEETTPEEAPVYSLRAIVDGRESFNASRSMFPGSHLEFFVRHSL